MDTMIPGHETLRERQIRDLVARTPLPPRATRLDVRFTDTWDADPIAWIDLFVPPGGHYSDADVQSYGVVMDDLEEEARRITPGRIAAVRYRVEPGTAP